MKLIMLLSLVFLLFGLFTSTVVAGAISSNMVANGSWTFSPPPIIAPGTELRVLAFGDSITYGFGSSGGNGYRLPLQKALSGSNLHYVGNERCGNMDDNSCEGHPGANIGQIWGAGHSALKHDPNIVLVHAGTNDFTPFANQSWHDAAPSRLGKMIDGIFGAVPNACVLVAQLLPAEDREINDRIQRFNSKVPEVVNQRAGQGRRVLTVNMSLVGLGGLSDGLHPSDHGYQRMAEIWAGGLEEADRRGWITRPQGATRSAREVCAVKPNYVPAETPMETPINNGTSLGGAGVLFANLNGDGLDDYVVVGVDGSITVWFNGGPKPDTVDVTWQAGNWLWWPVNDGKPIFLPGGATSRDQVHLADITGDGRFEVLIVDRRTGAVRAFWNNGPSTATGAWDWWYIGQIFPGSNIGGQNVRFADMTGDGKADYCAVDTDSELSMRCWQDVLGFSTRGAAPLNGGRPVAQGMATAASQIQLADVDGDGRADFARVHNGTGTVDVWLNEFEGGVAGWKAYDGPVLPGAPFVIDSRTIQFAVLTHSGRADHVIVNPASGAVMAFLNKCAQLRQS